MAAGRAIVASRTGGITEAVADRSTALLVPPGDPHALGVALAELAYRPDLRARLGRNARRAAEPYDIATVAEQNLRVYHQVVRLGRIAH
jgi:glycosyltransferase involved in cell wall biosynthesis